jgi:hypothetical protein
MSLRSFHLWTIRFRIGRSRRVVSKYKAVRVNSIYSLFPHSHFTYYVSQRVSFNINIIKMPRGLDIMIAFISSTAIIFNLSTHILPLSVNRAFSSIITILPTYEGSPSFEFAFNGKCYADSVKVSCLDSILEIARASSTGYEDVSAYRMGHRYYSLMKVVITTYTICTSNHICQ